MDGESIGKSNKRKNGLSLDYCKSINEYLSDYQDKDDKYNKNFFKCIPKLKFKNNDNESVIHSKMKISNKTISDINNIYNFSDYLYSNEEHFNKNIRESKNNSILPPKSPIRKYKKNFNLHKSCQELMNYSNIYLSHPNKNKILNYSSIRKTKNRLRGTNLSNISRKMNHDFKKEQKLYKGYNLKGRKVNSVNNLTKYNFRNNINIKLSNNYINNIKKEGKKIIGDKISEKEIKSINKNNKMKSILDKIEKLFHCCLN